ncbi:uncharacterized protein LOC135466050 isoform X2 [Liolophura sinensis]|uniref:uncharacterized protein LOC135466050 isoform X2 n=1 Tax=Liolophura sinensis TaxID=3198878 RepID=UPI00315966B2
MEHFIICVTDFQSGCLKKFLELGKGQPVADTRFSAFQPVTYITAWTIDGQSCVKLADNSAENHYTGTSNLWLRVGEACMRSDKSGESNDQTSSPDDSQSEGRFLLAEKLLEAADGLLTHGCCVEVVISLSVRSLQVIQAESLVMLYASLKRLRIWHNAAIKVLVNEGSYTESNPLLGWMTHLEAEVIGRVKELTVPSHLTLWRGQALVLDSRRHVPGVESRL